MIKVIANSIDIVSSARDFEAKKEAYFSALLDGQLFDPEIKTEAITGKLKAIHFPIVEVSRRVLEHM